MATCSMCEKELPAQVMLEGICKACRTTHRLLPPSPPRRPLIPCTRCQGRSFVRARAIRERAATGGDVVTEYIDCLAITYQLANTKTFWGGRIVDEPDTSAPAGLLETYVCRSCGFVEWYALEPERIPIGPEYATDLIELPDQGPYR